MIRVLLRWCAAVAALALALPAAASAGTASVAPEGGNSGVAMYVAAPGETNDVTVRYDGEAVIVQDAGALVLPAAGCTAVDAHTAACTVDATPLPWAHVKLGDGNDRVTLAPGVGGPQLGLIGEGGEGTDVLDASAGWNIAVLDGGPGSDRLTGTRHPDILRDSDDSADVLDGGGMDDGVDYGARTSAITVDLAAGTSSAGDTLQSIENVAGGGGDDRLRGDAHANVLDGGPGHDVVSGRRGQDELGVPLNVSEGPQEGLLRQSSSRGDSVWCGGGKRDLVNRRRATEFIPASCELVRVPRRVPFGTFPLLLKTRPTASGRYTFFCSEPEDWDDPRWAALHCSGGLTLREASGRHRLLATARIPRGRGDIVTHVRWTATGRRLAGRAGGVRARLRLHGHNVPRTGWTLRAHRR